MSNPMVRWALGAALAAGCGLGATGCVAVAAGAGVGAAVAYVNGNAEGLVEAKPERIVESAHSVFREMEVELVSSEQDDREWVVKGKTPKGGPVKVTIRQLGEEACKMWVRVGRFGDEDFSVTVFERIEARL